MDKYGEYVENVKKTLKDNDLLIKNNTVAQGLRVTLGDEKITEIFQELLRKEEIPDYYNYYWVAQKLVEMCNSPLSEDGLRYPSHHWINGELWWILGEVSEQLNRLRGVSASEGVVYPEGSCYGSKGFWTIDFDTIEDFNHFLWAGCYRYLPFTKNTDWLILPNLGDPDYNEKKIRMELHYMKLNAKKDEMERDFKEMAEHIKKYADDEEDIRINLTTIGL